jgi:hypothetical protein
MLIEEIKNKNSQGILPTLGQMRKMVLCVMKFLFISFSGK